MKQNTSSEKTIDEYYMNGGKSFRIELIDGFRDGGTGLIKTSIGTFYIHQRNKTLHSAYPPGEENLITDDLLKAYIISRIAEFIKRSEASLARNKKMLAELK